MYVIGDKRGNRNAFDALEGTFGSLEFTYIEAAVVLQNSLDIDEQAVAKLIQELVRSGTIKEA